MNHIRRSDLSVAQSACICVVLPEISVSTLRDRPRAHAICIQIAEYLDSFVIGQERAKKVLAVGYAAVACVHIVANCVFDVWLSTLQNSIYNHYARVRTNLRHSEE
jgi:hypothetical protein